MSEFDQYATRYTDDINAAIAFSGQSHDFFTKVKADYLLALLEETFPQASALKVLDVGCGHGAIHPFLRAARRPLSLTGIDVAASVIDEARKTNEGVDYQVYDGNSLPYADGAFDACFTICVMHHVPPANWSAFVSEMRRVVRPGGIVAVFEHNPLNPVTRRIVNTCPIDENAVLLKSGELKGLLAAAGLRDVASRFILFSPFDRPVFRRLDRWLGWLPLGAQYFVTGRPR
jgi:SAM-dependent methyltransferase